MISVRWQHVLWSSLKVAKDRDKFQLYWKAEGSAYWVWGSNRIYHFEAFVKAAADVSQFEASYKVTGNEVASREDVLALTPPPVNALGALLVESTSRIAQKSSFSIVSPDYSRPITWYQNATQASQETLTDEGLGVFGSAHTLWINVEHPKAFAEEILNPGWATGGFQQQDFWYYSWWLADGTRRRRNYYDPVIEVRPGGVGDWIVANPADVMPTPPDAGPHYGYTVDYVAGKIHFSSTTGWTSGTTIRASYYWTEETGAKSAFEVGPPSGKIWHLTRTEVQLSVAHSWRDTVLFEGKQQGVVGSRAQYKSWTNMQSTAMALAVVVEGATGTAEPFPAGPENGWTWGGTNGERGATKKMEIHPWVYPKPYVLVGSLQNKVRVSLVSGKKFTETDVANITYYIDEYDE